jgi:hypothetical protein
MSQGLNRDTIDKFYTVPETVRLCMEKIQIERNSLIIEPSAGNGAFIEAIKSITTNHRFYDIEPEHTDIIKQDFLTTVLEPECHVVGNPPFGRQSSTAIKFIKHCCSFKVKSINFILPKSFKKESMKKYFDQYYHLEYEMDLPDNSFKVGENIVNVPCIFQIWKIKDLPREKTQKLKPMNFQFVKKSEQHDFAIRRVGVNAGTVIYDTENLSEQSHYFIRSELRNFTLQFDFNNTVGPRSISKQELICAMKR